MARPRNAPAVRWIPDSTGTKRAHCDLRSWGGTRTALCAPGETIGTTDSELALQFLARELAALRIAERRVMEAAKTSGLPSAATLEPSKPRLSRKRLADTAFGPCAGWHHTELEKEFKKARRSVEWLKTVELYLARAAGFFGPETDITRITVEDLDAFVEHLRALPTGRGDERSDGGIRQHLNSLSAMYARAMKRWPGYVKENPVAEMTVKPPLMKDAERGFLEVWQGALLLETARLYYPISEKPKFEPDYAYQLVATPLFTGARLREFLPLTVGAFNFTTGIVLIPPLKKGPKAKPRPVPIHPQYRAIMQPYLDKRFGPPPAGRDAHREWKAQGIFPSPRKHLAGKPIDGIYGLFDRIAYVAGFHDVVRPHMLRHTYAAARLQTLHEGHPIDTLRNPDARLSAEGACSRRSRHIEEVACQR